MAHVNLVGVQNLDFETNDGKAIQGIKLHMNYLNKNVEGLKADTKFISRDACNQANITLDSLRPLIGGVVDLDVGIDGTVCGITEVIQK